MSSKVSNNWFTLGGAVRGQHLALKKFTGELLGGVLLCFFGGSKGAIDLKAFS